MEIDSLNSDVISASTQSATQLATDFDQFLTLLTAQLQNQDPLDPLDSNEFVAQLVSFTGVEQAIATNTNLENLIALIKTDQAATAVGYLGTTVEANGDQITLANEEALFSYTLPENTNSTSILIVDEAGDTVFAGDGAITVGVHDFVWDGRDTYGNLMPDGIYQVTVTSFTVDDSILSIPTIIGGRVTRVETIDGETNLTINGISISIDDILSVSESPPLIKFFTGLDP